MDWPTVTLILGVITTIAATLLKIFLNNPSAKKEETSVIPIKEVQKSAVDQVQDERIKTLFQRVETVEASFNKLNSLLLELLTNRKK